MSYIHGKYHIYKASIIYTRHVSYIQDTYHIYKAGIIYTRQVSYIPGENTFIGCWWGKYDNLLTQVYHISWGQRPRWIWYLWVKNFSYFLNPHAMNILLYRMQPRKHIHLKYCWQAYFKSIGTLSQTFKNHIHNNKEIQDQYPRENQYFYLYLWTKRKYFFKFIF